MRSTDSGTSPEHLYEAAPCGYHSLDALGRFVSINRTELAWLGRPADQLIGQRSPRDFFSPASQQRFDENFPALRDRGRLDNLELDLISCDGRVRHVLVSAASVVDAQGQFMGSNSVMHDVTALHAAQNELAARADEQEAMLNNELVGMVKVRAGCITWTNRGMDRIFGYAPGEMAGMPIAKIFLDETHYQRTAGRIGGLQYRVGLFREDQELRRKDGSSVWVDVSTVKIDPSGRESFTVAKDISDRKLAEVQRLRAAELEAQNLALQETDRLKSEFLANLSHELRTPLNAITSFSYLLGVNKVVAEVPKLASHVRNIEESGKHLLELIQTMLDFAKNESSKLQFKPSPLIVVDALNEVAGILEAKRLQAGVEMTVAVEPGLGMVVNDPLRLRQMLLNLLGNAIKFSRRGGAVRLEARSLDSERWCVVVADEGIGIAAADLPRLFAPFVQLSAGSTKAYGGTGLGLALVRSIARAQGGDVQVQSELDKGSVFTLTLPRSLPREDAKNSESSG
jgi:PAS domain S-box-containing protein